MSEFIEQNTCYCQNDKRGVKYFYKKTYETILSKAISQGNENIIQLLQGKKRQ